MRTDDCPAAIEAGFATIVTVGTPAAAALTVMVTCADDVPPEPVTVIV